MELWEVLIKVAPLMVSHVGIEIATLRYPVW